MEFNNKKLERTSKFVNYVISIALCIFLISLSARIMDDIDDWQEQPLIESFEDVDFIKSKESEMSNVDVEMKGLREKQEGITNTISIAENNYKNAKSSFDNWLEARKTVGSPNEDNEVLSRAKELDEFYKVEQEWRLELNKVNIEMDKLNEKRNKLYDEIDDERGRAYEQLEISMRKYDLKVFLIRLLFVLPILLIGIFFIVKFRKHKFWPLFLGFVLFSFYVFFFGLVPYLPSYGGYIRYTVGIVLSIVLGIYAINKIRAFIESKKNELKESTTERAKKVQTETAEKALDNHMCPSCGKDFIVRQWDKSVGKKNTMPAFSHITNFCRYCGLELFKECKSCNTENFAHLPFCSNCGDELNNNSSN